MNPNSVQSLKNRAGLARLATRVINTPLMIHQDKLNVILEVLGERLGLAELPFTSVASERPKVEHSKNKLTGALGVIPVYGSLVYRTNGLNALSSLTAYDRIRTDFQTALNDPEISAILFDIDSPGGEVAGVFDLVDDIFQARGIKPIYALANEMAYSAAYAIASAADQIYVPRTGGLGSVGVVAVHLDQTAADAKEGLKYTYVYAGARKIDFTPHAALSPEAYQVIQKEVDETYALFIETVARNRNLASSKIKETNAGIFQGRYAVAAGLADQVMSWNQAVGQIISKQGGIRMNQTELKTQLEALLTTPGVDAEAALKELGYVAATQQTASADNLEKTKAAAGEAAKKEILHIMDLCTLAGLPDAAAGLVRQGVSMEEARKQILKAKSEQSGKDEIISTISAYSNDEANPLLNDAKKRSLRSQKK